MQKIKTVEKTIIAILQTIYVSQVAINKQIVRILPQYVWQQINVGVMNPMIVVVENSAINLMSALFVQREVPTVLLIQADTIVQLILVAGVNLHLIAHQTITVVVTEYAWLVVKVIKIV